MSVAFRKYRKTAAHSYCFGVFPTLELLTHQPDKAVNVLLVNERGGGNGVEHIRSICRQRHIPVLVAPRAIERIGGAGSAVVGVFKKYDQAIASHTDHLVLVNPRYMGNLGTIIRTMVGFGLRDLALIQPAPHILAPEVVRGSMGAVFQTRWQYYTDFAAYRRRHRHHLYCLMPDGRARLDQLVVRQPYALVFGSEGDGLPSRFHQLGTSVRIPQTEQVDSLNLAVAVAITLYHVAAREAKQPAPSASPRPHPRGSSF